MIKNSDKDINFISITIITTIIITITIILINNNIQTIINTQNK